MNDTTGRPASGVAGSGELSTDEPFIRCPKCGKGDWQSTVAAGQCLGCKRAAAIARANAKAFEMARSKVYPALLSSDVTAEGTRQTWAVASRVTAGTVYLVELHADYTGVSTLCQCEAANCGRLCWHRSAVRLALFGDIDHHDARGHQADPEELAELLVWWSQEPDPADAADWTTAVAS